MNTPPFSISECTTFPRTFAEDVVAYREGGADGIGIWELKLSKSGDAENLALLRESGLRATICVPEVPSIYPDAYFAEPLEPRERTQRLCDAIRRLAPFDPVGILVVLGDPAGRDLAEMRRVTVQGVREAAAVAADLGIKIGVEFYRQASGSMLNTIVETAGLVDEIGAPNVGMVVDLWHAYPNPKLVEDLHTYAPKFLAVQVNDVREPTRSWADRVLPGDGVMDLPAALGAAEAGGYDGWYDLEIFSDDGRFGNAFPDSIAAMDPVEVTRRGVAGFRAAWERRQPRVA